MANYESTCRTNYFRVTDEEKYQKLFRGLSAYALCDLSKADSEGNMWHAFGAYETPCWCESEETDCEEFDLFIENLREILPDNEAFICLESGSEKLRYVQGMYIVATNQDVRWGEINDLAVYAAREMLGNSDFTTATTYVTSHVFDVAKEDV